MVVASNLPGDLTIEILSRLPVKSLLRFRCVHKTWLCPLKSSYFIAEHLQNPNNKDHAFVFVKYTNASGMSRFKLLTHDTLEVSLDLGLPFPRWDTVVGSCNGLVCLYIDHHFPRTKILLYNPAVRVHKIIPESTLPGPESRSVGHVLLGFGYDSVNNDYKVVRVVSLDCHKEGKLVSSVKAEVYTLGMNSWREVEIPPGVNFGLYEPQVFLNGAIHWLGMVEKNRNAIKVVVSFDVSTEMFNLIPLPVFALREIWPMWIDVYKNSLCVVKTAEGTCYEIWVMKEYGVQESWIRLHAIQLSPSHPPWLLGLGMNGKLVLQNLTGLTVYDPNTEEIKNVEFDHPVVSWFSIATYTESLVSV
ncbi:PREDICTED: F-box/kelch-repeat protein At3g06240 [Theobroma cacao]|uniref:F-box/kelch-repeat protein At3g06240 n=1 Tax=Theobroma cacao TaxID=3641 RepID=A0AB32WFC1_THECC|nr:PREDICTED: F-box/kelch-repeat protein At3g06240 [Theobroma cacao]